ncbi:hypothetical protein Misp01_76490 [Microtetraspora sp. NBRC 13810]|nr:hypothetical protein Misp01_76490 [Microtetraspora sp. NBRC 13810]
MLQGAIYWISVLTSPGSAKPLDTSATTLNFPALRLTPLLLPFLDNALVRRREERVKMQRPQRSEDERS